MNKRQKEVIQHQLTMENIVLKELENEYREALKDINLKIQLFQSMPETQSRIYHRQYQETLKKQVEAALEKLHSDEYTTINQYLHEAYTDAFVGTMYDLHGQGTPVIAPIDQNAAIKAVMTDTRLNKPLYTKLGVDVNKLKRTVSSEISRGIASGLMYEEIARNIQFRTNAPINRAKVIVRTEGHRIQQASTEDARQAAKAKGANVVKQWDATLDGDTRPTHRALDGQIRETDEPFEMHGKKAMYPGDFGDPAEDCNCRCVALTRSRSALDEEELAILKERAKFFQLDKPKDFGDFKKKYTKAAKQEAKDEATVVDISKKSTEVLLDAYEDRRKHFGLKYTPADEVINTSLSSVTADYAGLSVETAKAFSDTFEELSKDYYTGFTKIEVADRKDMFGVTAFATTKHIDSIAQKTLSINPIKTADYNALVKRIEELAKQGYSVDIIDGKTGAYVMTHEFAHSLLDMKTPLKNYVGMDEKLMRKARKEVDAIYSRYKDEVTELEKVKRSLESKFMLVDDVAEAEKLRKEFETVRDRLKEVKISGYAMKDSDEFLAEAFTQDKIGSSHSPYADELMGVLDKYFKKK